MVKPSHRDQWLRPIECVAIGEGRIKLRAPNRYHKEWFEDHYLPSILRDLQARTQTTFSVEFEISEDGLTVVRPEVAAAVEVRPEPVAPPRTLEPRYTFDQFV